MKEIKFSPLLFLLILVSSVSNFPFILSELCDASSLQSVLFMWFSFCAAVSMHGLNDFRGT